MLYGIEPYAIRRFMGLPAGRDQSVLSPFWALLQDGTRPRVYLLEAFPYDPSTTPLGSLFGQVEFGHIPFGADEGVEAVRFSAGSLAPIFASELWAARMDIVMNAEVAIFSNRGGVGGSGVPTFGQTTIKIGDGDHDAQTAMHWDGRPVTIYLGAQEFDFEEFQAIFKGTAQEVVWNESELQIILRDGAARLDVPIQQTLYAGTGGLEGSDDLKNQPKPLTYGSPRNVSPVLVDRTALIYQFHDRQAQGVTAVYDRGVALTKANAGLNDITQLGLASIYDWTAIAGQFITDLMQGLIRVGAEPDGTLTADVQGDAVGGFAQTTGAIVRRILTSKAGLLDPEDLEPSAFQQLDLANSAPISYYVREGGNSVRSIMDELMPPIGGFWRFTWQGTFTLGVIAFQTPVLLIQDDAHLRTYQRVQTDLPLWRLKIGYAKAWTVQPQQELDKSSAPAAIKDFVGQEFRYAEKSDQTVRDRRLLAEELTIPGWFDLPSDAQAEADRQHALFSADRHRYDVELADYQFRAQAGHTVQLRLPRFGLASGRAFIVLGIAEQTDGQQTTLRLWG